MEYGFKSNLENSSRCTQARYGSLKDKLKIEESISIEPLFYFTVIYWWDFVLEVKKMS